ncbi:MarR family winged helix-turn-helix transcriptional regulator [Tropicimonas isoalkanivorans]|uniref:DNA-binding transcriptional regulator, MarR family n=1 Tax=Tropicimonas isoalkanivorans TaxID=441112 RepID=A0A1I1KFR4_9RHOB|nr:MarR family transcriptional regulator [Tropicimonas isoalkanivorans]SFC59122.1 DNA-binding transcriptional regulator, MarR family [Tropicimonas isoalkanivorans]
MDLTDNDDPLDLDRQVCFPLYAASNLLNRLYRPILSELGLTYPQYLVMLVLWKHTPQTVGSLGELLFLDSGTLTPLLKRMETGGLITRTRDTADERRVLIHLTQKGRDLRSPALRVPEALAERLDIDIEEVVRLRDQVSRLVASLHTSSQATGSTSTERKPC